MNVSIPERELRFPLHVCFIPELEPDWSLMSQRFRVHPGFSVFSVKAPADFVQFNPQGSRLQERISPPLAAAPGNHVAKHVAFPVQQEVFTQEKTKTTWNSTTGTTDNPTVAPPGAFWLHFLFIRTTFTMLR